MNNPDMDKTNTKSRNHAAHIGGIYVLIGAVIGAFITGILTDSFVMRLLMGTQSLTGFQVDAYKSLYEKYEELNNDYDILYQKLNEITIKENEIQNHKMELDELKEKYNNLQTDHDNILHQHSNLVDENESLLNTVESLNQRISDLTNQPYESPKSTIKPNEPEDKMIDFSKLKVSFESIKNYELAAILFSGLTLIIVIALLKRENIEGRR